MALAALIVSILAAAISAGATYYNKRSAVAAEGSSVAADRSADAAKDAAEHAKSSADSAALVARAELERDHRELRPPHPQPPTFVTPPNARTNKATLWLEFTLDQDYRVGGVYTNHGSAALNPLASGVAHAGIPYQVFVEELDPEQKKPVADFLYLRFWPPGANDKADHWACPCGRPLVEGEQGHWEWKVPVSIPDDFYPPQILWA